MKGPYSQIQLFSVISNLTVPDGFQCKFGPFEIQKNDKATKYLIRPQILSVLGKMKISAFHSNPFLYGNPNQLSADRFPNLVFMSSGIASSYLNALWFVKDNCVATDIMYGIATGQNGNDIISDQRRHTYLATGMMTAVEFSLDDLNTALSFSDRMRTICDVPRSIDLSIPIMPFPDSTIRVTRNPIDTQLGKLNRVGRAYITFLTMARETYILPIRIMLYMALLECLFVNSDDNIGRQIRKRLTKYLGGSAAVRSSISDDLTEAYNVRSLFAHGKRYPDHNDSLLNLSVAIDNLIRRVFIKIVDSDSKKFVDDKEHSDLLNYLLPQTELNSGDS